MNKLSRDEQCQVIAALVEGDSIRSVERMAEIHRDTIMRLMVRIGDGCDGLIDQRMQMRRFTRLTNGFSKKRVNHAAAVLLHFAHYNLVRIHKTLRMTPAMAHGIADHIWTVNELLEKISS